MAVKSRVAVVERNTKETKIKLTLDLDGTGVCKTDTGIGFFDHMIDGFTRHGLFDVDLKCEGDPDVDSHHSVEDVGIVIGTAIREALGDKKGIRRYGHFTLPMDEALVVCAVDLSGRPYFVSDCRYTADKVGGVDTEMFYDFFYAISYAAMINLHIKQISGTNNHHIAEASFKAFARALDMAVSYEERAPGVWSTKGSL
jgi:imidazoleglycerol-phosphate dehydratase